MRTVVDDLAALEARARRGDARAFGELARAWDHDLRGVVWSVVRSATDTDDIMQAAYEKAFRSIAAFRGEASMKTWLHSICYRAAVDHLRRESIRRHDGDELLSTHSAPDSTSDAAITRTELASALEQLGVDERALLMLVAGLGHSFSEAAEITGLPRGTVASKVSRAREQLRRTASPKTEGEAR